MQIFFKKIFSFFYKKVLTDRILCAIIISESKEREEIKMENTYYVIDGNGNFICIETEGIAQAMADEVGGDAILITAEML